MYLITTLINTDVVAALCNRESNEAKTLVHSLPRCGLIHLTPPIKLRYSL